MQSRGQVSVPRTTRLKNNQVKSRKRAFNSQKEKSDDKGAVAIMKTVPQLGCVSQDSEPPRLPKGVKFRKTWGKKFWDQFDEYDSQSTLRQASIREKDHRLGKIQVKNPHERSPYAVKFEDRSQEETERQQRCNRGKA